MNNDSNDDLNNVFMDDSNDQNEDLNEELNEISNELNEASEPAAETLGSEASVDSFTDEAPGDDSKLDAVTEESSEIEAFANENPSAVKIKNEKKPPKKGMPLKNKVFIGALAVFVLAVAAVCVFVFVGLGSNKLDDKTIMIYEGQRIGTDELELFNAVGEQSDYDYALDMLEEYLAIMHYAQSNGILVSDEDKAAALASTSELREHLTSIGVELPNLSDERLSEFLSVEALYSQIIVKLSDEAEIDEADFQTEFDRYKTDYRQYYIGMDMKYLITETIEDADDAINRISSGEDVDDVIRNYSIAYTEEAGIQLITLSDLQPSEEELDELLELEIGEPSDPLDLGGAFAVFIVQSVSIPSDDELAGSFMEMYVQHLGSDAFETKLQEWKADAKFELNEALFESLKAKAAE